MVIAICIFLSTGGSLASYPIKVNVSPAKNMFIPLFNSSILSRVYALDKLTAVAKEDLKSCLFLKQLLM